VYGMEVVQAYMSHIQVVRMCMHVHACAGLHEPHTGSAYVHACAGLHEPHIGSVPVHACVCLYLWYCVYMCMILFFNLEIIEEFIMVALFTVRV